MLHRKQYRLSIVASVLLGAILALAACTSGPYEETFDEQGRWPNEGDQFAVGGVVGGVYELLVNAEFGLYWATGGQNFGDGTYRVEATQVEGPLDNGYGMAFMVDNENDNFYAFLVSGDGFVRIDRCQGGCEVEEVTLVGTGWEEAEAVKEGLNQTNVLMVEVLDGNMIFFVNGQEVGRATDVTFSEGDIGLLVETLGAGGVRVHFDNYTYVPAN